jgi:hypothetical protein
MDGFDLVHDFVMPGWARQRTRFTDTFGTAPYEFTISHDRADYVPLFFDITLRYPTNPIHIFYHVVLLCPRVPNPVLDGDCYVCEHQPKLAVRFDCLQKDIQKYFVSDAAMTLRIIIKTNLLWVHRFQPDRLGFVGLARSIFRYLNSFLQCLFRVASIRQAVLDSGSALTPLFWEMSDSQFPPTARLPISFDYESIITFVEQFIPSFLPRPIAYSFAITFRDRQTFSLSVQDLEAGPVVKEDPTYLLVEGAENFPEAFEFGCTHYSLLAVIVKEGGADSAFIFHNRLDRWLHFADEIVVEVPYDDGFNAATRSAILCMYVRSGSDIDSGRAPTTPKSTSLPVSEMPLHLLLPSSVAGHVARGDFGFDRDNFNHISISPGSTYNEIYHRVALWTQSFDRSLGLWPLVDGLVGEKLPRSDDSVEIVPPLVLQFSYPDQDDADYFVFVAAYCGQPPPELLFTLQIDRRARVGDVVGWTSRYLATDPPPTFELFLAADRATVVHLTDLDATFEELRVDRGSIMVIETDGPWGEMMVPPSQCQMMANDFLTESRPAERFIRFLELRQESRSIIVRHQSVMRTVTFPISIPFCAFSSFVVRNFGLPIFERIDSALFYPPYATKPILTTADAVCQYVLDGFEVLELLVFQRIVKECFAGTVRLDIAVDAKRERRFVQIFPAAMRVADLLVRAAERSWIGTATYCVLKVNGRGRFLRLFANETPLSDLENPLKLEKLGNSMKKLEQGAFLGIVRSERGDSVINFRLNESLADLRVRLAEFCFHEDEEPQRFAVAGEEVLNQSLIVTDLLDRDDPVLEVIKSRFRDTAPLPGSGHWVIACPGGPSSSE